MRNATQNANNGENKMNAVTADSSKKEITAEIRKQARAYAKKFGCKVSVRRTDYKTIRVSITESERPHRCADFRAWQAANPEGAASCYADENGIERTYVRFTDWANELLDGLKEIANQFNWDKSDIMTDYFHCNYYAFVDFCGALDCRVCAELDAEREALEAAEAPANVVAVNFTSAQGNNATEDKTDAEIESEMAAIESELQAVQAERARLERMLIIASKKKQLDAERAKVAQLQELLASCAP